MKTLLRQLAAEQPESEYSKEELEKLHKLLLHEEKKKLEELKYKLGYQLKFDYQNYIDSVNMPMSIALGENLKEQIKEIFKILQKNGIDGFLK